jgi:beta-xylosidase
MNERKEIRREVCVWVVLILVLAFADGVRASNPIVPGTGLTDPYAVVYGDRVYIYATHDFSPANSWFVMKDWWVWSSEDLVNWRKEGVLKPEDTFIGRPFNDCWATCAIERNGKYYWYFSAGPKEIGVVVSDSPAGPWRDPFGKPLIPQGLTPTEQRDPNVLMADDGNAYLVYGTFN